MKHRIFFKLLAAFVVVIAVATLTLDLSVRKAWEESLYNEIRTALVQKAVMFGQTVEQEGDRRSLQQIANEVSNSADARATIIDAQGRVLADTRANPAEMENHANRPEFMFALHGSIGSATRVSHTVGIPFLYVAAPVSGGAVRLAYPLSSIRAMTRRVRLHLLYASLVGLGLATVFSAVVAEAVSRRLGRIVQFADRVAGGDLTARIAETSMDEIGHVAAALDATAHKLQQSFEELRTSQQQLETLLNSMQEAVIAVSADRRVQWANGVMSRLAPGSIRLGAPVVETIRDPDFLRAIEEALAHRVHTVRATSIVPGRFYEITAAPMPGLGAVAVLHDVTEIERVEKTRRDFVANVSHELRTPLTSIQGYAETLLDSPAGQASQREFLEIIRKNAARMAALTEDLLTLARVESGEVEFNFRPVPPSELLEDAAQSFREMAKARGVELVVESAAFRTVEADAAAIHQVFSNLLDNALKYGGSGHKILLGTRDTGERVEFYVRDYGPGIASEHLPRLFERFYRVDKARSRESGGTGLGLAIAKHIVRRHGGSIRAESVLGHGSTFTVSLPRATAAAVSTS